ncbi:FliA/WhiG family RNA polymerase sigma factor [Alkaliphilus pronyensis]|uniref:RNA polymerase sigma factor n=1 Tax=Alkaliphilus pronyensis TaxID=1482732 RepID=A0A6I0FBD9_9FIRM|nr:FliA/WhiG family RNA polymerase sigma factor [Alkaliphilus pronyensis]KAB3535856.1 FliA/WhiG family RNA polymerase sigma factor [Alkaliphilus pronyensis]
MDYLSLWQKYKKNNDTDAKHRLIETYIELVKIVAGRLSTTYGSNVEYEDLVSYGVFGLLDAIEKFELDKNVKFETYAQIRIRGAIVDHLRSLDWIPRSIRQKAKEVDAVFRRLENNFGRSVTDKEVAAELGVGLKEFYTILQQIHNLNVVSLEEQLTETNIKTISDEADNIPENIVCGKEIKDVLKNTIDQLPERERQVISLYYYEELTYKEIGAILNISESRVSQLHSKAISRLKGKLA